MSEQWLQAELWPVVKAKSRRRKSASPLGKYVEEQMQAMGYNPHDGYRMGQFAAIAAVEAQAIYRILSGQTKKPHRATLRCLANALQLTEVQSKELFSLAGFTTLEPFSP